MYVLQMPKSVARPRKLFRAFTLLLLLLLSSTHTNGETSNKTARRRLLPIIIRTMFNYLVDRECSKTSFPGMICYPGRRKHLETLLLPISNNSCISCFKVSELQFNKLWFIKLETKYIGVCMIPVGIQNIC